jgi:hypothetical protein
MALARAALTFDIMGNTRVFLPEDNTGKQRWNKPPLCYNEARRQSGK